MTGVSTFELVEQTVRSALADAGRRPLIVGLCGAQGSGKSTIAAALVTTFRAGDITAATLSLDDLYLGRAERAVLARDVHPLLHTRGVPGTHDVALGLEVFAALDRGEAVRLPRFDKALDNRAVATERSITAAPLDVLLVEGWCVGARPQPAAMLERPVNRLEREEDADGRWRRWVNATLGGAYQRLFARLDRLILLAAPSFDVVHGWRLEQEQRLRERGRRPEMMSDAELGRFVEHYERLTRHILVEMPPRADLTIRLAADRSVSASTGWGGGGIE